MAAESTVWCVCVSPDWSVWSLGEGQAPEDLEKPIDTPPLSTLLIEKPSSATVTVGEWERNREEELKMVEDIWGNTLTDFLAERREEWYHCRVCER